MKIKDIIKEAHPNQQMSLYQPDGKTYRGEPMPGYDNNDIFMRRQQVPDLSADDHERWLDNDTIPGRDPVDNKKLKSVMMKQFATLNKQQQEVMQLRFLSDMTLEKVAKVMGITIERVRQIEQKALRILRQGGEDNPFLKFLESKGSFHKIEPDWIKRHIGTYSFSGKQVHVYRAGVHNGTRYYGYTWVDNNGKEHYEECDALPDGSINKQAIKDEVEYSLKESAKPANTKAKNYVRKGGNSEHVAWEVTLKNGKKKKVYAANRSGVDDFMSSEDKILGYTAKKL